MKLRRLEHSDLPELNESVLRFYGRLGATSSLNQRFTLTREGYEALARS